jgi:hypothetical protein
MPATMSEYQSKLWYYFLNKGYVTEGDEQRFMRNHPSDEIAKRTYYQWNKPNSSRSKYLDDNQYFGSNVETRKRRRGEISIKRKRIDNKPKRKAVWTEALDQTHKERVEIGRKLFWGGMEKAGFEITPKDRKKKIKKSRVKRCKCKK